MRQFLARMMFRPDHRWAPDRMSEYLDGDLAQGRRSRMERHLGVCVECRRLLAGLTLVVDALHRLPAPQPGRDTTQLAGAVRLRLEQPPPAS
jgi:anti-sigma factor RsiW